MIKKYYTIKADTRIAAPRAHQNSSMGASYDAARAGSKPSGSQTGRRGSAHDSARPVDRGRGQNSQLVVFAVNQRLKFGRRSQQLRRAMQLETLAFTASTHLAAAATTKATSSPSPRLPPPPLATKRVRQNLGATNRSSANLAVHSPRARKPVERRAPSGTPSSAAAPRCAPLHRLPKQRDTGRGRKWKNTTSCPK